MGVKGAIPTAKALIKDTDTVASSDVREHAIIEVLQRNDKTYLTAHPELIEHESNDARAIAIRNWGAIKSPEASLMIRKGLTRFKDRR